jgi:predicted flap endonuclease-1-like 5' DNA nuclease
MPLALSAERRLERWSALVEDCLFAQQASLRAAALLASVVNVSPFDVTDLISGMQPTRSSRAAGRDVERRFQPLAKPEGQADDLTRIRGVGAKIQERLNELGIFQFNQLAALSEPDVHLLDAEIDGTDRAARNDWVGQAKAIGKAAELGFQALAKPLGRADDLTLIKGVGPKVQEKLNELGVFHFWQLASLAKAGAEHLDAEIGAKGRVLRDDWAAQAKRLAEEVAA